MKTIEGEQRLEGRETVTALMQKVVLPFVLSRVWVALFVYMAHSQRLFLGPVLGGWEGVPHWWLNPWTTYDSLWFVTIATQGYEPTATVFFPLYPMLLSLAGPDMIDVALWGVVLSHLTFLIALVFFYKLTRLDHDERTATTAVWLLAFFPSGAFFSALYSESLFLCLIVLSLYAVRRQAWGLAGFFGLLASLTRNSGAIICLVLLLEYAIWIRYSWRAIRPLPLIAVFLPALGLIATQLFFAYLFGDWLLSLSTQRQFQRALGWPWEPVVKDIWRLVSLGELDLTSFFTLFISMLVSFGTTVLNVTASLVGFALTFFYWRKQPLSYTLLLMAILLMHLTYARVTPAQTIGALRYMSTTFPFVQLLALAFCDLRRWLPVLLLAASFYLLANIVTCYLFGLKLFLG